MGTQQTGYVTLSCDNKGCDRNVTFEATEQAQQDAIRSNPWLDNIRRVTPTGAVIQTPQGPQVIKREFLYCSDTCEAEAIITGNHNKLEPSRLVTATPQMAAQAAAQAAAAQAMKSPILAP